MNRRTDSVAKIATKADLDLETVMNTRNNVLKMSTRHIVTSVAVAHFLTWCFNLNLPAQHIESPVVEIRNARAGCGILFH